MFCKTVCTNSTTLNRLERPANAIITGNRTKQHKVVIRYTSSEFNPKESRKVRLKYLRSLNEERKSYINSKKNNDIAKPSSAEQNSVEFQISGWMRQSYVSTDTTATTTKPSNYMVSGSKRLLLKTSKGHGYLFNCSDGFFLRPPFLDRILFTSTYSYITHFGGFLPLCLSLLNRGCTSLTIHAPKTGILNLRQPRTFSKNEKPTGSSMSDKYWWNSFERAFSDETGESFFRNILARTKLMAYLNDIDIKFHNQAEDGVFDDGNGVKIEQIEFNVDIARDPTFNVKTSKDSNLCTNKGTALAYLVTVQQSTGNEADADGSKNLSTKVLILDCPTQEHGDALSKHPRISGEIIADPTLKCIFHLSNERICSSISYMKWMDDTCPEKIQHVLLNWNSQFLERRKVSKSTKKDIGTEFLFKCRSTENLLSQHNVSLNHVHELRTICPHLFPNFSSDYQTPSLDEETQFDGFPHRNRISSLEHLQTERVIPGLSNVRYSFSPPSVGLNLNYIQPLVKFEPLAVENRVKKEIPSDLMDTLHNTVDHTKPEYPKVTFIGTGGDAPSLTRGSSCIVVEPFPDSYVMLDCGCQSYDRLMFHFGFEKFNHVMRNLRTIYISHIHGDHVFGLISFLEHRNRFFGGERLPILFLVCSAQLLTYLHFLHKNWQLLFDNVRFILAESLCLEPSERYSNFCQKSAHRFNPSGHGQGMTSMQHNIDFLKQKGQLASLATVKMNHTKHSFAVCFAWQNPVASSPPYSLIYTGDCRPNLPGLQLLRDQMTLETGKSDVNLLIHEAQYEDVFSDLARYNLHSTVGEAIRVGEKLGGVDFTMLTHFSKRNTILCGGSKSDGGSSKVGFSHDHMTVSPQTLHLSNTIPEALNYVWVDLTDKLERRRLSYRNAYKKHPIADQLCL